MQLGKYPRAKLAQLPTPLEFMPRLTRALGGPRLYVKRDDCTGLATGGNKTRKLEFLLGEALAQGADTLITLGAGTVQPRAPDRRRGGEIRPEMRDRAGEASLTDD